MDLAERNATLVALGCATDEQIEALGDGVFQAKDAGTVQVRCVAGEVKKLEDGSFRFKISDEAPDRMGDIVRQGGADTRNFEQNPVVLLGHDQDGLPIGKGVMIERAGQETYLRVKFSHANPQGKIAEAMVEEGTMRAVSIGFMPKAGGVYHPKDDAERKELGLGKYGVEFRSWELLEVSLVTVPANPNALAASLGKAVERGVCSESEARAFESKALPTERDMLKRIGTKAKTADGNTTQPPFACGGILPGGVLAWTGDGKEAVFPLAVFGNTLAPSVTLGTGVADWTFYPSATAPGIVTYPSYPTIQTLDFSPEPAWVSRLEKSIADLPDRIAAAITRALPQGVQPAVPAGTKAEETKAGGRHYSLASFLHDLNTAASKPSGTKG